MNRSGNDTALPKRNQSPLDWRAAVAYTAVAVAQYVFCRLVVEPYAGCYGAHGIFAALFLLLTVSYLWRQSLSGRLEAGSKPVERFLHNHPSLWFGVRAAVELAVLLAVFYWLGGQFWSLGPFDWHWLKTLLFWLFAADAVIAFLAYYGSQKTKEAIKAEVDKAYKRAENLVRTESIKEVFYLTTAASFALKGLLAILIAAGVLGAVGITGGILVVILPYFIFSVFYTALVITGSFAATVRYWQWLLTEPPKMVVRFIFKVNRDKVRCYHCERIIPLVGTWECPECHFKFKGHYFNWCPNCYTRFGYVNCECGLSRKRPYLY